MLPSLTYLLHNSTCERPRLLTNFCQEMIHRSKAFCIREAAATIAVPSRHATPRQCSLSIALEALRSNFTPRPYLFTLKQNRRP